MIALRSKVSSSELDDDDEPLESSLIEEELDDDEPLESPLVEEELDDIEPLESPTMQEELIPMSSDTTPSTTPEELHPGKTIALERAAARQFIVGEYIHRSAFHRGQMVEDMSLAHTQPRPSQTVTIVGSRPVRPSSPPHSANRAHDADSGAAGRTRFETSVISRGRGVRSSHNGHLRSSTPTGSSTASSTKSDMSMLNRTGFIGMAEARNNGK